MHQPVSSPDGHRLSCEGHADYMSATSTDQTARTQDTAGDNDASSDAVDRLPHTMNTGMLVNELEDEFLSNQENDSCLELEPHSYHSSLKLKSLKELSVHLRNLIT